jgi:hypothetical protein
MVLYPDELVPSTQVEVPPDGVVMVSSMRVECPPDEVVTSTRVSVFPDEFTTVYSVS